MTLFDKLTGTTAEGRLDYLERYISYYVDRVQDDMQPESFETWLLHLKLFSKGWYAMNMEVPTKQRVLNFIDECSKNSDSIIISGTTRACRALHNIMRSDGFYPPDYFPYKWIVLKADESLRDSTPIYNSMGAIISDFRWIITDDKGYLGMMEIQQNQQTVRKYIKQLKELGIAVVEQQ